MRRISWSTSKATTPVSVNSASNITDKSESPVITSPQDIVAQDRKGPGPKHETLPLTCSIAEAAAIVGVSYHTIYRLLKRGKLRSIPFIRHKRIPRVELERFLREIE